MDSTGRDATAEELGVLSPNRTAESQGGCKNRPLLRFACTESLPRIGFDVGDSVLFTLERGQGFQRRQRFRGISTGLLHRRGQVLFSFQLR